MGDRTIVCISGTSRPGNYTVRALGVIVDELKQRGEAVGLVDGRELDLNFPGKPVTADAEALTAQVKAAAGVILASPEYHGSICAHTKLILENLGFPSVLSGKPVALAGVAAGRIGAIKSLEQLKGVCSHVGALVVPGAVSIAGVQGVFDGDTITDEGSEKALRGVATSMIDFLDHYVCPKLQLEAMVREGGKPWTTTV